MILFAPLISSDIADILQNTKQEPLQKNKRV